VKRLVRLASAGALSCALIVVAACGGDRERAVGPGGTLTLLSSSDVDFLDPGRTAFAQGVQVARATQRALYGYAPTDLSKRVPDLAAREATVSADGRTITVPIRAGVRFSPPVDREVTSHDVAYALSRIFSRNVACPYFGYFGDLVGAPDELTDGVPRIRGITTPDEHTIVFRLRHATSETFLKALTMAASAPVPEEYARPFDERNPSTYNTHVVATGPYMVRNDAQGDTVGYRAGRSIELVRNPRWNRRTDARPAHLDAVRIRTDAADRVVASRQVLNGSHMVLDNTPAPSILKLVSKRYRSQSLRLPSGGYRFVPLTTTIKPFDRLDVRRAVLAGFDRISARKALGGQVAGPLATHYLPPGIPGHEQAGGLDGPRFDFLSPATEGGDPELAAKYMRKAGFPSGRYTGKEEFLVVSGSTEQERNLSLVVQDQLEKLGFRIRLRHVPDDALFTNWCSVPAKKVLACSGVLWLKDFPDAEPMLRPVFDGSMISRTVGNTNFSQLDDPKINAAMAAARILTGPARDRAWGEIDRLILADAPAVPIIWDDATLIRSKDVKGVPNVYFDSWDLSYTSLE
jgi:peptide/nickel transport system substrate-binding protein